LYLLILGKIGNPNNKQTIPEFQTKISIFFWGILEYHFVKSEKHTIYQHTDKSEKHIENAGI
jgi:hypothetical protein